MLSSIKLVIFDFDGVFTDGKCYFDSSNNVNKYYNVKDGMALSLLKKKGIKTGLISSYSNDKNIIINEIDNNISSHLNFDYKYVGKNNKMNILQTWINELNITLANVAYIGDDINDLEILSQAAYSGCPNDAIIKCKNIVSYICKNKGGNGCVREFVETIINNDMYPIISEIKQEFDYQINNFNMNDIDELYKLIINCTDNCTGNIHVTGIGKSLIIAQYCCTLLKSISINAFMFDAIDALHGDLGVIKDNDILLLFSKSGNTQELINLLSNINNKPITIGLCCNNESEFSKICNNTFVLPFNNEISGEINKIPSNSFMSHMLFINILIEKLKHNITINTYKLNHPGGHIGNNLKKIKDLLIYDYPKLLIDESISLNTILLTMTNKNIGCCFFVNNDDDLIGILTDGDIRRLLLKYPNISHINIDNINTLYYHETDINKYVCEIPKQYTYIPILIDKKILAIIKY